MTDEIKLTPLAGNSIPFTGVGSHPGPCTFIAEVAPNPGQPWSGVAVCRCATHNWPFPVGTMPDPVCPLGRIQLATEAAIAAIHAAVKP